MMNDLFRSSAEALDVWTERCGECQGHRTRTCRKR